MLTIERATRELRRLPVLVRIGLALVLVGGFADVAAHLSTTADRSHGFTAAEVSAHVVVVVGMVLILLGVVVDGVRQSRLDRSVGDTTKGGM